MKQEGLRYFSQIQYPIAALAIFMIVFAAVGIWVYRRSAKDFYEKMGQLPLEENKQEGL